MHAEDATGPTLADAEQLPHMRDSLRLSGGPYQFFPATDTRAENTASPLSASR
jgi:hypothetical protein